jgi:hypothetical protein
MACCTKPHGPLKMVEGDIDHNFSFIVSGIHLDSIFLTNLFVCSAKVNVKICVGQLSRLEAWSDGLLLTV